MVLMNPFAAQQWRHRHREQACGRSEGGEAGPASELQSSSVHLLSRVRLFATAWTAARQASLSITNS